MTQEPEQAHTLVLRLAESPAWLSSDLKAVVADNSCTLPEASGSAPQEIDPTKENEVLFTYSVHWEVGDWGTSSRVFPDGVKAELMQSCLFRPAR